MRRVLLDRHSYFSVVGIGMYVVRSLTCMLGPATVVRSAFGILSGAQEVVREIKI